ncbi:MAG: PAC2 family protein [Endomicrobia bacterium]|nr:PAC2 family protein [Endomicrobiia bacterium]MDW8056474.1 PAC2 family protein [Elusimicrobiota bacterium]
MIIQKGKIKLKRPILFCAWPSLGIIGKYVIEYLVSELKPSVYAEVDLQGYVVSENVIVENGIIYSLPFIKDKIYYLKRDTEDLLFFCSDFEPSQLYMAKFGNDLLTFLNQTELTMVVTFSGIPSKILHTDVPKIYYASTSSLKTIPYFSTTNLQKLTSGIIEGMNGVVLSLAKEMGIDGICLFCEVPFYTVDMYNPQCTLKILNLLDDLFSFNLTYERIYKDIKLMDERIRSMFKDINEKAQQLFSKLQNHTYKNEEETEPVIFDFSTSEGITFEELKKRIKFSLPQSAKNKINELFKLASENIEYSKQLKEELDRWGVYKEYEDRFLSLFLKKKKDGKEKQE